MKVKTSVAGLGKATLGAAPCLALGRRISNVECGLAYAARAIQTGNASGLVQGLEVASRFSVEVESLMPKEAAEARAIKSAAESIGRDLKKKKKVSSAQAEKILIRIRGLAKRTVGLHERAQKHCGGSR